MSHEKMICSVKKMKTGTKEKRPQQKQMITEEGNSTELSDSATQMFFQIIVGSALTVVAICCCMNATELNCIVASKTRQSAGADIFSRLRIYKLQL